MDKISRRDFIFLSASFSLLVPVHGYALAVENNSPIIYYPDTLSVLKQAFHSEMSAHKRYIKFVEKALAENYPNIAYLFHSFSFSEKIHATNYDRIINKLGSKIQNIPILINVRDTKSNLSIAAQKELEKIKITYPGFLKNLKIEEYEEAIINCMYSWKSHRQHEKKIKTIQKYAESFFGSVAKKIEGLSLDFHVCEICGSTIDEEPDSPCEICNKSMSHYQKINRPT